MKIALTSQNKYKKKILFDVIEEEEDEDKNKVNNKNQNLPQNLDINVLQSENIGNKNENDIFIDTKYSNINSKNGIKEKDKIISKNSDYSLFFFVS